MTEQDPGIAMQLWLIEARQQDSAKSFRRLWTELAAQLERLIAIGQLHSDLRNPTASTDKLAASIGNLDTRLETVQDRLT